MIKSASKSEAPSPLSQSSASLSTEVAVIGGGPAGYVCAIRLAQLGKKVTLIEKAELGGVCLNRGCIPSKAFISAGSLYHRLASKEVEEMGIETQGVQIQLPKLAKWKNSIVEKLTSGIAQLLKAHQCKVLSGEARFVDSHTLEIRSKAETTRLTFQQAVIATGSRPTSLPSFEVDQKLIFDSTGALQLQMEKLPASLLCIGGGYIGLELGIFYAKLGVQVTVLEAGPELLAGIDPELTQVVRRQLDHLKVKVCLDSQVTELQKEGSQATISWKQHKDGTSSQASFQMITVTVGRTPNSENLGLEKIGLQPDRKGFLSVDAQRRTTLPHIFAIGDIAGQPLLAHKGSHEGLVAAEVIAGKNRIYDIQAMPAVVFTDPEIATVGLTELQAKAQAIPIKIGKFPFSANGRALSLGETEGFVKLISHAQTGVLLGAHMVGPEVSQLISEATLAIEMGAHVEDLSLTVHPHPTLSETIMEAADATFGHAIHLYQKPTAPQR